MGEGRKNDGSYDALSQSGEPRADLKGGDAVISICGHYRYRLTRTWGDAPPATFVMLNPSTADASLDDPTIRKCRGFARRWNCGGLVVVNLFAFRATSPADMKRAADPVGPHNWHYLESACVNAHLNKSPLICAWGASGKHLGQDKKFLDRCEHSWGIYPKALRITIMSKAPEHPLYVPYGAAPVPLR